MATSAYCRSAKSVSRASISGGIVMVFETKPTLSPRDRSPSKNSWRPAGSPVAKGTAGQGGTVAERPRTSERREARVHLLHRAWSHQDYLPRAVQQAQA